MTEATSRRSAYSRLLDRAVRILAMRDHSEQELRRKLAAPVMGKNGPEDIDATPEDYDKVIAWCIESRYLDDDRFVQQFISSRSRKGYGPARVRQELNQKGFRGKPLNEPCASAKLTGQHLRARRPFVNTENLYL